MTPPRLRSAFLACLIPAASEAGTGIFGTKASPVQAADSGSSIGLLPAIQMFVALALVLAMVKWLMPLAFKKYGHRITGNSGSGIRVQETAMLGPANLAVVAVRGKTLLLGATSAGVSCLADLTSTEALPPTFQELLEDADKSKPTDDLSDLAGQLERLRRIGG